MALVRAMAAGDQRALRALHERTHHLVFTFLARLFNDRRSAEEVTVDTFHGVWQRAAQYDPAGGPVLGWIMNQARSRAIEAIQQGHALRESLSVLTAGECEAIEAAFFLELSYPEVAARLNQCADKSQCFVVTTAFGHRGSPR